MTILLVGCTGFVGEALLYQLLTQTKHNIILVIRSKNNKSVEERLEGMLGSVRLKYRKYQKRMKLVQVSYDDDRNIVMSSADDDYIINNTTVLVNALADVHMNRELRKATLNNTVTALNWMKKFQQCTKSSLYLYISTAYVNFHRIQAGDIPEQILEKDMSHTTLSNILYNRQTDYGSYSNTYVYSKQLAEVLLRDSIGDKRLVILRPSVIIPAFNLPYPGWGKLQTISYVMLGIGTGILPLVRYDNQHNQNTVPVDIVAEDCMMVIDKDKGAKPFEIRHCCLTGNMKGWTHARSNERIAQRAYEYFQLNPLVINDKVMIPHKLAIKRGWFHLLITIIIQIIGIIFHWWEWSDGVGEAFVMLYRTISMTYKFDRNLARFSHKTLVFERLPKHNDITYPDTSFEDCYYEFVKNLQSVIGSDPGIIKLFS